MSKSSSKVPTLKDLNFINDFKGFRILLESDVYNALINRLENDTLVSSIFGLIDCVINSSLHLLFVQFLTIISLLTKDYVTLVQFTSVRATTQIYKSFTNLMKFLYKFDGIFCLCKAIRRSTTPLNCWSLLMTGYSVNKLLAVFVTKWFDKPDH